MIISTGMANEEEIAEAIKTAKDNGCQELVVLHCVSGYPAPADQYNLKDLNLVAWNKRYSEMFNYPEGFLQVAK